MIIASHATADINFSIEDVVEKAECIFVAEVKDVINGKSTGELFYEIIPQHVIFSSVTKDKLKGFYYRNSPESNELLLGKKYLFCLNLKKSKGEESVLINKFDYLGALSVEKSSQTNIVENYIPNTARLIHELLQRGYSLPNDLVKIDEEYYPNSSKGNMSWMIILSLTAIALLSILIYKIRGSTLRGILGDPLKK